MSSHFNSAQLAMEEEQDGLAPLPTESRNRFKKKKGGHKPVDPEAAAIAMKQTKVVYDYDVKSFVTTKPMRELRFRLPCLRNPLVLNPLTTLIGIVPLWSVVIWCALLPEDALASLLEMRGNVAQSWSWFIIITKPLSFFFLLWITYKYGHIRFGGRDAKPEFGDFEYFTMVFCTGVGVGMFYYGVSEPLWHQTSHSFAEAGYRSQDEIDQMALLITIYHWGFHAYTGYLTVALATSLASYRFRLPLIFRSAFYPILGEYTWGYLGDILDGTCIVVTIGGICTSLGLGATQISAGAQRVGILGEDLSESQAMKAQVIIIWLITMMVTASVVAGITIGLRNLSKIAFCLGVFLTLAVFMMDQSAYLLNIGVQSMGAYLHEGLLKLSFYTDSFGQLRDGEGRAIDDKSSATWWFDAWTIFYWNWWVSWSVFVGLFTTRISYGRTLREVTTYSVILPIFYLISWFSIWGGAGLRQSRQALELEQLGETYFNDTEHFLSAESDYCFDVPQDSIVIGDEAIFENHLKGVTPVCKFESTAEASFNLLYSFSFPDEWDAGYGGMLSVVFVIALAVYFATSSDSGSMVVDILAANGRHDTHWSQRLFWVITEGAVATALLTAGGSDALSAVQAASIICGLPFTVILLYLLQSIYEMCEQASDESRMHFQPPKRHFIMPCYGGIFNVFEYMASLGRVHTSRVILGLDLPSEFQVSEFFTSLFLPFLPLQDILFTMYSKTNERVSNVVFLVIYTLCYFYWVAAFAMSLAKYPSMAYWGWMGFTVCGLMLGKLKNSVRKRRLLHGNLAGDLLSSFFLFPQVLTQIRIELMEYGAEQVKEEKGKKKKKHKRTRSMDNRSISSNSQRSLASSQMSKKIGSDSVTSTSTRHRRSRSKDRDLNGSVSSIQKSSGHSRDALLGSSSQEKRPPRDEIHDIVADTAQIQSDDDDEEYEEFANEPELEEIAHRSGHNRSSSRSASPMKAVNNRPTTPNMSLSDSNRPTSPTKSVNSRPTTPSMSLGGSNRSRTSTRMTASQVRSNFRESIAQRHNSRGSKQKQKQEQAPKLRTATQAERPPKTIETMQDEPVDFHNSVDV